MGLTFFIQVLFDIFLSEEKSLNWTFLKILLKKQSFHDRPKMPKSAIVIISPIFKLLFF